MTWSIEMKYNTIFMHNADTCNMYNYDVKYNVNFLCNNKV